VKAAQIQDFREMAERTGLKLVHLCLMMPCKDREHWITAPLEAW
jgi:hypothetical protein